jgi:hypothetical protein
MASWSIEQALALAPDPASAKAGQGLSNPAKWRLLGHSDRSVWGEIQGSGKEPYRTQVDLSGPAFHCSCPSRKFPCKHGLGLMLAFAGQPARVPLAEPPAWVAEYLAKREAGAERKAAKAQEAAGMPPDPETAARREADRERRAARREDRVREGLEGFQIWLADTARHGLAHARQHAARSWGDMAARLVDAQAPGLARLVREMESVAFAGDDWADRLLQRLGQLQLLVAAYQRLETLPAPLRADVRAAVGWTTSEEELAGAEVVSGQWQVLGQRLEEEEKLRVQRTWLLQAKTGRPALVLHFAAPGQALNVSLIPGMVMDADLVFYPSNFPLRAVVKSQRGEPLPLGEAWSWGNLAEALSFSATALAAQCWLERLPWCVQGCIPVPREGGWAVLDREGNAVPLARRFSQAWVLAALSGGHPLTIFGEWDGQAWLPLSVFESGRCVAVGGMTT